MMRAETYDELAQLEQLLDEYARCEALDPAKLPALAGPHLDAAARGRAAPRPRPRGGEQPALEDFGALIEHVDGYLCEIKDPQVRDGLHILGQAPEGEQFDGLRGILRLGARDVPAAARDRAAYGLDEPALLERAPWWSTAASVLARFPGLDSGADRRSLHDAQRALIALRRAATPRRAAPAPTCWPRDAGV